MSANCTATDDACEKSGGVFVAGLIAVLAFYLVILIIGLFASWKNKSLKSQKSEEIMLARRNVGVVIGIFTMTATWVGGGYINGTAEAVYNPALGLIWAQAPVGFSISLFLSGVFFAKPMRAAAYVTMLDPFHVRYGEFMAGLLYIPAFLGEVFWSASILSALGASLAVILNMSHDIAIIISTAIAVLYTVVGGLFSVIFTDVIQLLLVFFGLWLGVAFSINHEAVVPITQTSRDPSPGWLGKLDPDASIGNFLDFYMLFFLGGIPWQVYFQRVLSSRSAGRAQMLSFAAGFGCLVMAVPAVLIGAIGKSADWSNTSYPGPLPIPEESYGLILPLVLQYLTPSAVAVIGLGAVSAAVMSSADSSLLSSSSMFARNVYKPMRNFVSSRNKASEREVIWVMRISIVLVGCLATAIAIEVNSIYGLFTLCADLVYVILFPQLTAAIYMPFTNSYGSLMGFLLGLFFRLAGGEPLLSLPHLFKYPWYDEYEYQVFPFRTLSMLICLVSIVIFSWITMIIFEMQFLPLKYDFFKCFVPVEDENSRKMGIVGVQNHGYESDIVKSQQNGTHQHPLGEKGLTKRFKDSSDVDLDKITYEPRISRYGALCGDALVYYVPSRQDANIVLPGEPAYDIFLRYQVRMQPLDSAELAEHENDLGIMKQLVYEEFKKRELT